MQVSVHCNIRKRTLSVKALSGPHKGLVIASAEKIVMKDVTCHVSQAGRARVLKTKQKNVHAGMTGEIEAVWGATLRYDNLDNDALLNLGIGKPFTPVIGERVGYNPYKASSFVVLDTKAPVHSAKRVYLDGCAAWAQEVK